MSKFNERTGEIELTQEDKDCLQGKDRVDTRDWINKIIWGNNTNYYEGKTRTTKEGNTVPVESSKF